MTREVNFTLGRHQILWTPCGYPVRAASGTSTAGVIKEKNPVGFYQCEVTPSDIRLCCNVAFAVSASRALGLNNGQQIPLLKVD